MEGVPYFIPVEDAQSITLNTLPSTRAEECELDLAHGRILSQDLVSKVNDPPFDNSSMDGFACRLQPTATYPLTLKISGIVAASGHDHTHVLNEGEAFRIMTGAPMPEGADSILQIERCEIAEDEATVTLLEAPKPHFVRKMSENLTQGEVTLKQGTLLTPSRVGLCATMGYATVPVYKPLVVGILSTGDELKAPGTELKHGEIYESNSYGLAGLVQWMGHEAKRYSSVNDSMDALRASLDAASEECDVILTSGGVSMGEFDYVRRIMEEEGDIHFWRMKIRPGSPPLFGTWKNTPLFGLPGNPVSSHVVFRMLVAPYLRHALNTDGPVEWKVRAKLCDKIKSTKDCLTLRRVTLTSTEEGMMAHQPRHQGSGNLESLASADALTLLQPGQSGDVGEWIDVLVIE